MLGLSSNKQDYFNAGANASSQASSAPYDGVRFHLETESDRLKVVDACDYDKLAAQLEQLGQPGKTPEEIAEYNSKYIELYKPYDSSFEFHSQLKLGTFDDSRVMPSFAELTLEYPELSVPYLDQRHVNLEHLAPHQRFWADNGFLLLEGLIDESDCNEYLSLRNRLQLGTKPFPDFVPYLHYDVVKRMFCSVIMNALINDLIGEELGIHFNLTPFVSTERGWHQDEYLNPPDTYGRYVAVWIAVDDVPESSGPFEFVRGSHKLPTVCKDKVMPYLKPQFQAGDLNRQDWSGHSSTFVNPAYFLKFAGDGQPVTKFLGKKGDVLIWHSRLIHRGSPPADPNSVRPGIIGHYSPIRTARWFGGDIRRYGLGGYYWNFD